MQAGRADLGLIVIPAAFMRRGGVLAMNACIRKSRSSSAHADADFLGRIGPRNERTLFCGMRVRNDEQAVLFDASGWLVTLRSCLCAV